MLDLRLLRYFVAVAETEHVGRAAARLHISQSPLSRQIRVLEEELGLPLFERTGRRVRLTAPGHWLLGRARELLGRADRLEREAERLKNGTEGTVQVGYVSTAMWTGLLPATLRRHRKQHPDIQVGLRTLPSVEQIGAILRGDLDLGIVHLARPHPELIVTALLEDPLLLAVADDHPLARKKALAPRDLDGAPWIALVTPGHASSREELVAACGRAGFVPDLRYEATDRASILGLVSAGFGLAFVPASVRKVPIPGVRLRELSFFKAASRLLLVSKRDGASPAALTLAAALTGAASGAG